MYNDSATPVNNNNSNNTNTNNNNNNSASWSNANAFPNANSLYPPDAPRNDENNHNMHNEAESKEKEEEEDHLFYQSLLAKINALGAYRHDYQQTHFELYLSQQEALRRCQQELQQARLQVAEADAKSGRLLHENLVLCTQDKAQREKLEALLALSTARRARIRELMAWQGQQQQPPQAARRANKRSLNASSISSSRIEAAPWRQPPPPHAQRDKQYPSSVSLRAAAAHVAPWRGADDEDDDVADGARCAAPRRTKAAAAAAAAALEDSSYHDYAVHYEPTGAAAAAAGVPRRLPAEDDDDGGDEDLAALAVLAQPTAHHAAQLLALTEQVRHLQDALPAQPPQPAPARAAQQQEAEAAAAAHHEVVRYFQTTLAHVEELHEVSLRELLRQRHAAHKVAKAQAAQLLWLKQSLQEAVKMVGHERTEKQKERSRGESAVTERLAPVIDQLKREVERRGSQLQQTQQHLGRTTQTQQDTIADLTAQLKKEKELRRREATRYRLEMEGVQNELNLMRSSLRCVEKKIYYGKAKEEDGDRAARQLIDNFY